MKIRLMEYADIPKWVALSREFDHYVLELVPDLSEWYNGNEAEVSFEAYMNAKIAKQEAFMAVDTQEDCSGVIAFSRNSNNITFFGVSHRADMQTAGHALLTYALAQLDSSKPVSANIMASAAPHIQAWRELYLVCGFLKSHDSTECGVPVNTYVKTSITTVYFIRHAQADNTNRDGRNRPLTQKGLADRKRVTEFLQDKRIDAVLSSPFRRAVDTVTDFAEQNGHAVELIEGFRERKSDSDWDRDADYAALIKRQWADFTYTQSDGECLGDVQARNIAALVEVLSRYRNKNIVIGTHGTALSTIIHYYDNTYGFEDFMAMAELLPWIVKMEFDENGFMGMERKI